MVNGQRLVSPAFGESSKGSPALEKVALVSPTFGETSVVSPALRN
jgi:hypothetical protein